VSLISALIRASQAIMNIYKISLAHEASTSGLFTESPYNEIGILSLAQLEFDAIHHL
jgi:hypothetical protein